MSPGLADGNTLPSAVNIPGNELATHNHGGIKRRAIMATKNVDAICFVVIAAAFCALLSVWFYFDKRIPTTDEAGHILNALDYKHLLLHAKPLKLGWWHAFLSVNKFYPPMVYIFNGVLKCCFGNGRVVDVVSSIVFELVYTFSVYSIARIAGRSTLAACLAAVIANVYPLIVNISRTFLLDFPLTAMIAIGLLSLMWWDERPTKRRCGLAAIGLAAACMTKQIAAAYLILPGIWLFASSLFNSIACRSWSHFQTQRLLHLMFMAMTVSMVVLPWTAVNWHWIHSYSAETGANTARRRSVSAMTSSIKRVISRRTSSCAVRVSSRAGQNSPSSLRMS